MPPTSSSKACPSSPNPGPSAVTPQPLEPTKALWQQEERGWRKSHPLKKTLPTPQSRGQAPYLPLLPPTRLGPPCWSGHKIRVIVYHPSPPSGAEKNMVTNGKALEMLDGLQLRGEAQGGRVSGQLDGDPRVRIRLCNGPPTLEQSFLCQLPPPPCLAVLFPHFGQSWGTGGGKSSYRGGGLQGGSTLIVRISMRL